MSEIRIPTALRSYTDGQEQLEVGATTVAAALQELADRYPGLAPHLFDNSGELRPYVNLFINEVDIRTLGGSQTPIGTGDKLMILPSIAGGDGEPLKAVDHSAMQTSMAARLGLLLAAFIVDQPWLVAAVGLFMWVGTLRGRPDLVGVYRALRRLGWVGPDLIPDNPEPHRFSLGVGATFLTAASLAFASGAALAGWTLTWIVMGLTALNLFGGFCVGCAVYYWLNRLGAPGFTKAPPAGVIPGQRPSKPEQEP